VEHNPSSSGSIRTPEKYKNKSRSPEFKVQGSGEIDEDTPRGGENARDSNEEW